MRVAKLKTNAKPNPHEASRHIRRAHPAADTLGHVQRTIELYLDTHLLLPDRGELAEAFLYAFRADRSMRPKTDLIAGLIRSPGKRAHFGAPDWEALAALLKFYACLSDPNETGRLDNFLGTPDPRAMSLALKALVPCLEVPEARASLTEREWSALHDLIKLFHKGDRGRPAEEAAPRVRQLWGKLAAARYREEKRRANESHKRAGGASRKNIKQSERLPYIIQEIVREYPEVQDEEPLTQRYVLRLLGKLREGETVGAIAQQLNGALKRSRPKTPSTSTPHKRANI
jgi:hypothetical protein